MFGWVEPLPAAADSFRKLKRLKQRDEIPQAKCLDCGPEFDSDESQEVGVSHPSIFQFPFVYDPLFPSSER